MQNNRIWRNRLTPMTISYLQYYNTKQNACHTQNNRLNLIILTLNPLFQHNFERLKNIFIKFAVNNAKQSFHFDSNLKKNLNI